MIFIRKLVSCLINLSLHFRLVVRECRLIYCKVFEHFYLQVMHVACYDQRMQGRAHVDVDHLAHFAANNLLTL